MTTGEILLLEILGLVYTIGNSFFSLGLENHIKTKKSRFLGIFETGLLVEFGCLILSFPSTTHHECNIVSTSKNMPFSLLSLGNCSFALP